MKTQPFNAFIKTIQYGKFENKRKSGDPFLYYAQCILLESKHGKSKPTYHNALLYLTPEQFETQQLKPMDRLKIGENAQWECKSISLNIYDEKKLKEFNVSRLLKDQNGKTYGKVYFYAYTLIAKQTDWNVIEPAEQACYVQVMEGVKFFMPDTHMSDPSYCFFFTKDTYDKLVDHNFEVITIRCYKHRQLKWTKKAELQTAFDPTSQKFFCNLVIKGV